jgi:hypothetical protein
VSWWTASKSNPPQTAELALPTVSVSVPGVRIQRVVKGMRRLKEKTNLEAADRFTALLAKPLDQREATGELIRRS